MSRFLTHQRAVMIAVACIFVAALAVEHEARSSKDDAGAEHQRARLRRA